MAVVGLAQQHMGIELRFERVLADHGGQGDSLAIVLLSRQTLHRVQILDHAGAVDIQRLLDNRM